MRSLSREHRRLLSAAAPVRTAPARTAPGAVRCRVRKRYCFGDEVCKFRLMNPAIPFDKKQSDVRLRSALVQRISGTAYFVADAYSLVRAERSAGCLLRPEQDDLVLISEDSLGHVSILTVLERKATKPAMVSVDGDLEVKGESNLSFEGGRGLNLLTRKIFLQAEQGSMKIKDLTFSGELFTACGRQLCSLYQTVDIQAKGLVERVNRLYRRIRDEDARLGRMQCRVQGEYTVRAEDGFFDAEKKMELKSGKKIELG
ncbi:MAG: DUF3540 domain-containing protein [Candidatus Electrothrix sp. EH2]|nr:DUF3540 domain-containing protein [Candidatus Electrothrix sp. EH2]